MAALPAVTTAGPAVVVEGLTKTYSRKHAVDDVSFSVEPGEIFALLGPNGAGKTTTVEILEGYRRPDSGSVRVLGLDPISQAAELKPQIGAMLQEGGVYPVLSARQALDLFANYYPDPMPAGRLLSMVGLDGDAETPYRRLSGGQKQRVSLALALVGRPRLVFLDEPTAGLDPQARRATWSIIGELRDSGITVMLTTHYLEEAERLADRVAILVDGRLAAIGRPGELTGGDSTTVRLRTDRPVPLDLLSSLPAASRVRAIGGGEYTVETRDAGALLEQITARMRPEGILPLELRVGQNTLEDLFLSLADEAVL